MSDQNQGKIVIGAKPVKKLHLGVYNIGNSIKNKITEESTARLNEEVEKVVHDSASVEEGFCKFEQMGDFKTRPSTQGLDQPRIKVIFKRPAQSKNTRHHESKLNTILGIQDGAQQKLTVRQQALFTPVIQQDREKRLQQEPKAAPVPEAANDLSTTMGAPNMVDAATDDEYANVIAVIVDEE